MSADIVIRWRDPAGTREQRRTLVTLGGATWAVVDAEDVPTRLLVDVEDRKHRFAKLQRCYYPAGLKPGPFALPPSNVRIVRDEAHPLALYVATEEIVRALSLLGQPTAITLADIRESFPSLGAPYWLQDCEDGDFVDFAMDAAGYEWTRHRIGPPRSTMSKTRYVYVSRQLDDKQRVAAIKELKARARRSTARE